MNDFTGGLFTVDFNKGSTFPLSDCATIPTTTDDVFEGDHAFFVSISDIRPDGAVIIDTPANHTVTITDDGM